MDGSFACPECGSTVEVQGLAPGRRVRCPFCQRLLEVPYLPRTPVAPWRRRRFQRARWVYWSWAVIAVVAALALVAGGLRFWNSHHQSVQAESISKLIQSSKAHEAAGRLNQALIDLDAALELARTAEPVHRMHLETQRKRRQELARADAQSVLDRLVQDDSSPFPLGAWLNLVARSEHDPDLEPLKRRVGEQFRAALTRQIHSELDSARRSFDSGDAASLQACDRIARLLPHLDADSRQVLRHETEDLVNRLVASRGVVIEPPHGQFVLGSESSYVSSMLPILVKALAGKGYLPYDASSPWKGSWEHAKYRLRLDVSERLEGNYLASENRLTRIEVRLTLAARDGSPWQTTPTARTIEPLPGLPALSSSRMAFSRARSDDIERLLYDNARGQIDGRVAQALNLLPAFGNRR